MKSDSSKDKVVAEYVVNISGKVHLVSARDEPAKSTTHSSPQTVIMFSPLLRVEAIALAVMVSVQPPPNEQVTAAEEAPARSVVAVLVLLKVTDEAVIEVSVSLTRV